jgi:hypothetical protein
MVADDGRDGMRILDAHIEALRLRTIAVIFGNPFLNPFL